MNRWLSGAYVIPAREDEEDRTESGSPAELTSKPVTIALLEPVSSPTIT